MYDNRHTIAQADPQMAAIFENEFARQESYINLIASENYASPNVLAAQGSIMTNKYAEGYPERRYYGGCQHVDEAEALAIARLKELFQADYANVQPHSGSQANAAAYMALLQPGDSILGMSLPHGGHLTHGTKVNFSGKVYQAFQYGIDADSGLIDFNLVEDMAKAHQPKLIVAGFSAYSRHVDWQQFRIIADKIGAKLLVDMAHVSGLVAAGVYPNPVPVADVVTSTTHKTLRGPRGGIILARSNPDLEKKLNSAVFPGMQGGPMMHSIAAKAIAFQEALQPAFKTYQQEVINNARAMVDVLVSRGYKIVSGGTDNHLFLVDLIGKEYTGKDAEAALESANIIVNKNTVPNEPRSPFVTSGLRLGTPALTTRGFGISDVSTVANYICDILDNVNDADRRQAIKESVRELCARFPVYR